MTANAILTGKQMYYTSCKLGLSGAAGFQTKAKSPGLDTEQQQIIERLGVYKPPRNLPDEPSEDKILEEFPKLYRNSTLDSGQVVILRSEYVGKDYSNRWGNYFSHGLLINSLPINVWPVDIYEWTDWKKGLTSEEDASNNTELPDVQISNISNAFPLNDIQDFINEDSLSKKALPKIIQAVFLKASTSKNIVIKVDLESDAMYWVACIQKCFPVSLQKYLNSSTYQFDPRTCLDINVTFEETDLLLGETERNYQYYVFDFSTNKYTDIDQVNEYAKTVSSWVSKEPEKLVRFYQLCGYFYIEDVGDDLVTALELFRSSLGDQKFTNEEKLVNIFQFVNNKTKPQHYDDVAKIVNGIDRNTTAQLSYGISSHIADFYISASKVNNKYADDYLRLFPKLLLSWLVDNNQSDNSFIEIRNNARKSVPSFDKRFAEYLLSEQNITNLVTVSSRISTTKLGFLVKEFIDSKAILSDSSNESIYTKRIWDFITPVIISRSPNLGDLDWLLSSSLSDPNGLKTMLSAIMQIVRKQKQENYPGSVDSVAQYLNKLFRTKDSSYRYSILNALASEPTLHPVILSEWNIYFFQCKDKASCFSDYYSSFLSKSSGYLTSNHEDIIREAWKQSTQDDKQQLSIYLIDNCIDIVPHNLYADILFSATTAIPLVDVKSIALYDQLCGFRDINNISITPDTLYLRQVIEEQAYSDEPENPLETIVDIVSSHLQNADEELYCHFLNEFLPDVLHDRTTQSEHDAIVNKLYIKDKSNCFLNAYSTIFKSKGLRRKQVDWVVISFWLGDNISSERYSGYENIIENIRILIRQRLSDLDENQKHILVRHIKDKGVIHRTQINTWNNILSDSNKGSKAKSIINKLFGK